MADESGESGYGGDTWLEQTQYFARRVYEDPLIGPVPLDLYAACAIGNYECVQEAVNKGVNLNVNNKGVCVIYTCMWLFFVSIIS